MKPTKTPNNLRRQIVTALVTKQPSGWTQKVLGQDATGKSTVTEVQHSHQALKFPLANNVSDLNVERAARRWL